MLQSFKISYPSDQVKLLVEEVVSFMGVPEALL